MTRHSVHWHHHTLSALFVPTQHAKLDVVGIAVECPSATVIHCLKISHLIAPRRMLLPGISLTKSLCKLLSSYISRFPSLNTNVREGDLQKIPSEPAEP